MLTRVPCQHPSEHPCGGYLTDVEFEMSIIRPALSAQEYHDILITFEVAFENVERRWDNSRTEQTGSD